LLLAGERITPLATDGVAIGCFDRALFVSDRHTIAPGARLLVFSDGVYEIFLERDRVHTWEEFLAAFGNASVHAMRPAERLAHAQSLRGGATLEDDFSLLEVRFP
jgi:serine phosphatase RsbU (regulator of sigma subunit)